MKRLCLFFVVFVFSMFLFKNCDTSTPTNGSTEVDTNTKDSIDSIEMVNYFVQFILFNN